MPIRSSWYDSIAGDRPYGSDTWAQMTARIYTDGIFLVNGGELKVTETNPATLGVSVAVGAGLAAGRYGELYDAPLALTLAAADPTNARIDTIVLRRNLNTAVRATEIVVRTGTPAVTPLVPTLQQDATIWEVPLANVRVNAAVTFVNNANVTDRRLGVAPFRSAIGVLAGNINLLVNGGIEYWTKGAGPYTVASGSYIYQFTDGWLLFNGSATGATTVSKETTIVDQSKASAKIDIGASTVTDVSMTQRIEDFTQFQTKPFSFSARVRAGGNYQARVRIRETNASGRLDTYSPHYLGTNVWQTLSVTKLLRPDNTALEVSVVCAVTTTTVYVDNAMLVVSGEPVEYLPLPPADDQARGERYLQRVKVAVTGYLTSLNDSLYAAIPYRRSMAGTPSVTLQPIYADVNASTPGIDQMASHGGFLYSFAGAVPGHISVTRDVTLEYYI